MKKDILLLIALFISITSCNIEEEEAPPEPFEAITNPVPEHDSKLSSQPTTFSWQANDFTVTPTYEILFGTSVTSLNSIGTTNNTNFEYIDTLDYGTYFWKIKASDEYGDYITESSIFRFTYQKEFGSISNPVPVQASKLSGPPTFFSWQANDFIVTPTYEILLGTDTTSLNSIGITNNTNFEYADILNYGTYFWKIIATDEHGDYITESMVFTFTYQYTNVYNGDVILLSQQEVDDFVSNNYTSINGSLFLLGEGYIANDINDISGFSSLTSLSYDCQLYFRNTQLKSLEGLNNVHIHYSISLVNNINLTDVSQLSHITRVTDILQISSCDSLTNLQGLHNIQNAGFISIASNKNLTDINLINLSTCGSLEINNNRNLINLDGLSNLAYIDTNYDYIDSDLKISGNNLLNDFCGLNNLILNHGISGDYIVNNNLYNPSLQDFFEGNCSQ